MTTRRVASIAWLLAAATLAPAALACGFDEPSAMRKGLLNWAYPKALYVDTAVWQAQQQGLLAMDPRPDATSKLLVNPGYRRAVRTLETLGEQLPAGRGGRTSFVVLLMEAMLWTRFVIADGSVTVTPHIQGTLPGEAVIVTHRVAIEALDQGNLTIDHAMEAGVLRLYGEESHVTAALGLLRRRNAPQRLGLAVP